MVVPFESWSDLLAFARAGGALYYRAPLDHEPVRFVPRGEKPASCTYDVRPQTLRMWPPGSIGRGARRTADPFTANRAHLDRFAHLADPVKSTDPEDWFRPVREALRALGWRDEAMTVENTGGNCMCLFLRLDDEWHALVGDPWNCDGWAGMVENATNGEVRADLPSFPESDPAGFARAVTDLVATFGYRPDAVRP